MSLSFLLWNPNSPSLYKSSLQTFNHTVLYQFNLDRTSVGTSNLCQAKPAEQLSSYNPPCNVLGIPVELGSSVSQNPYLLFRWTPQVCGTHDPEKEYNGDRCFENHQVSKNVSTLFLYLNSYLTSWRIPGSNSCSLSTLTRSLHCLLVFVVLLEKFKAILAPEFCGEPV